MNNGEGIVGRLIDIYRDRLENTEFESNPIGMYVGNIFANGTIYKCTAGMKLQSFLTKHKDWALNPAHIYRICIYHPSHHGEGGSPMFIHGDDYIKPFEDRATDMYQDYIKAFVSDLENGNLSNSKYVGKGDFIEIEYLKVASTFDLFNEMREQYAKAALPSVYNRGFQRICVYIFHDKTIISLNQTEIWKSS
jgi:hypothetical protein